jgi:hypothetical protein
MIYHTYDSDGFLVGWYEADTSRPDSTPVAPTVPPSRARWDGSAWVEDASREAAAVAATRLAAAWSAADAHARSGLDENSRASLLWLSADPACPAWRRERILAVQAWWSAVWTHYAAVRESIQAGVDTKFDPAIPSACPWTIWQIAGSEP